MSYKPKGSTHRRCYCRDPETNKPLGAACPKRTQKGHGSWSWKLELPTTPDGERQHAGRAGYSTKTDAQGDLDRARALLMIPTMDDEAGRHRIARLIVKTLKEEKQLPDFEATQRKFKANASLDQDLTVAEWLDIWLKNKKKLKKRAAARYETDIRFHLKPRIGHIKVAKLTFNDLSQMFAGITEANEEIIAGNTARRLVEERRKEAARNKVSRAEQRAIVAELRAMPPFRRITGPATQLRIRATLRTALNAAIPAGLIILNPAAHVELDPGAPVRPRMWTAARVENWQETGVKPYPVMVWTPEQLGAFLDHIIGHRLYAMFHLIAFRGLRRGEACGARLQDLELVGKALTIATQLVYDDWANVREDTPKTDSSDAPIALDSGHRGRTPLLARAA